MRYRFTFCIRTASGRIVGNIVIEADDDSVAEDTLFQRYPGCTILNCDVWEQIPASRKKLC